MIQFIMLALLTAVLVALLFLFAYAVQKIGGSLSNHRRHAPYRYRFSLASVLVGLWVYLLVLLPACALWAIFWSVFVTDQLYYCSDSMGFDFLSPPFVHPPNSPTSPYPDIERSYQLLGYSGDFYLRGMNETKLNLVWGCFLLGMLATPGVVFYLIQRLDTWLVQRTEPR